MASREYPQCITMQSGGSFVSRVGLGYCLGCQSHAYKKVARVHLYTTQLFNAGSRLSIG